MNKKSASISNKKNLRQSVSLETMGHSCSHLMATAVLEIFPRTKLAIGPAIENGFYYDFELDRPLIPKDLKEIENRMWKIKKRNLLFKHEEWGIQKALNYFKKTGQKYKIELINDLKTDNPKLKSVSVYYVGNPSVRSGQVFIDLCAGPHVKNTQEIGFFRLTSIAGAYWRGDEKNKMLTRIYGTCFPTKEELDEYLQKLEEIAKRDHRKLGQELDLFEINNDFGAGLPLWHPKGTILRKAIEDYLYRELSKAGYQWVVTPHIAKIDLWKTSGHWGFYQENMYQPFKAEEQEFIVKPMNCPGHIKIFASQMRSYRELPIRYAEFGTVYRFEKSGVLHGLLRVRGFTQDDAHVFCRKDQMEVEIKKMVADALRILRQFGFHEYDIYLSTRPEKSVGSEENWQLATKALENVLKKEKVAYQLDSGEAVFYGPKIDIKVKDSLGRAWQCSTIQVDFNLPERFQINYIDEAGQKIQPIMIHRALIGSLERFIGVLIEHYAGAFSIWLAPVQAAIIPISQKHFKYACKVYQDLIDAGLRVDCDMSDETLGKKIRAAQLQKVPYMLIVGDKETKAGKVAVRTRSGRDMGAINLKKFIEKITEEIAKKK